ILYKKVQENGIEYFEFSTNPEDELYMVSFAYVGENAGNYILVNTNAIGKIYQYTPPIDGVKQGNYDPLIKLTPPSKTTLFAVSAGYKPTERTKIETEWSFSNQDQNLFSSIDDQNNKGWAAQLTARHQLVSKWNWTLEGNALFVHQHFRPIERMYSIEFDR